MAQEKTATAPASSTTTSQSSTTQPDTQSQKPATPADQQPSAPAAKKDENSKRMLGMVPNFQTTDIDPALSHPLTVKEKFVLAWHQYFDISAHIGNLLQTSIQQATNGEPHYGQGWIPFGQRFGASEADQFTSCYLIFGVLPSLLKDDPRYFRKAKGPVVKRMVYSMSRTFITRTDSGHATLNIPQIFGQFGQAGISNLYYPQQDRTLKGTMQGWATALTYNTAFNMLKEFYPDTIGRFFNHLHNHRSKTDEQPASAPAAKTPGDEE